MATTLYDISTSGVFSTSPCLRLTYGLFDYVLNNTEYIDHTESALNLLLQQFKRSPNLKFLISAFTARSQELETVYQKMLVLYDLNTAVGDALDIIGDRLCESRGGRSDEEFRKSLNTKKYLISSCGTPETIRKFTAEKCKAAFVRIFEGSIATVYIFVGVPGEFPVSLKSEIESVALAGVQVGISYILADVPLICFAPEGSLPLLKNGAKIHDSDPNYIGGYCVETL